jgi:hypothetical protein
MSGLDPRELSAILAGTRPPAGLERADRVRLIGEAARQLVDSGTEEGLFTGGALLAWLENGGDLERTFFRVAQRGSHHTPARLWSLIADERQDEDPAAG